MLGRERPVRTRVSSRWYRRQASAEAPWSEYLHVGSSRRSPGQIRNSAYMGVATYSHAALADDNATSCASASRSFPTLISRFGGSKGCSTRSFGWIDGNRPFVTDAGSTRERPRV
jgi:hypothetical protein